jgi:hypothetical protein
VARQGSAPRSTDKSPSHHFNACSPEIGSRGRSSEERKLVLSIANLPQNVKSASCWFDFLIFISALWQISKRQVKRFFNFL